MLTIPAAGIVAALVYALTVSRFAVPALLVAGGAAVLAVRAGRHRAGSTADAAVADVGGRDHGRADAAAAVAGARDAEATDDVPVAP
ncbi:MAG TPA: hypothetical protein VK891_06505 [Euzebyales bacterium]|nr:hypothetical protein [Euzebyales bacterium]